MRIQEFAPVPEEIGCKIRGTAGTVSCMFALVIPWVLLASEYAVALAMVAKFSPQLHRGFLSGRALLLKAQGGPAHDKAIREAVTRMLEQAARVGEGTVRAGTNNAIAGGKLHFNFSPGINEIEVELGKDAVSLFLPSSRWAPQLAQRFTTEFVAQLRTVGSGMFDKSYVSKMFGRPYTAPVNLGETVVELVPFPG